MRAPVILLLCGMLVPAAVRAENARISGYVTRALSPSDFDVNGIRIQCGKQTRTVIRGENDSEISGCPKAAPYVGERATVAGAVQMQDGRLSAKRIEFAQQHPGAVAGSALIESLPDSKSSAPKAGSLLLRADGYRILITEKTLVTWTAPLHSLADVKAGDWIDYEAKQQADGTLVTDRAWLAPVVVKKSEEKFREKNSFDPSNVPASAKQNVLHEAFFGVDYKKIPPASDAAVQARIEEIGNKLIPTFEQNLPDTNPAKIDFRFQLTADPKEQEVASLSSGIILIPREAVERMQNDSQVAALLADGIAGALERGPYRTHEAVKKTAITSYVLLNPAEAAGLVAGARASASRKQHEQNGRVALGLLRDAGYDIDQAPVAWWLLASKEPKPISEIPLPHRAAYLYKILGECWNSPEAVAERR